MLLPRHDRRAGVGTRPAEDLVEGADLPFDDGPFVDHPDAFHQDALRAQWREMLTIVIDRLLLAEVVLTVLPAEQAIDDLRDLQPERFLEIGFFDVPPVDEDRSEPLQV